MRKKIFIGAIVAMLATAATASAIELRLGEIIIHADGGFKPTALPRTHNAPISIHGGGSLSTVSGKLPPIIRKITLYFDRHGAVETIGLPTCTEKKLEATTVKMARRACPGAIVGKGFGRAIIKFPEQGPIPVHSPITVFNGPRKHGDPTILAHAYITVPVPTTFIVPVIIEKVNKGPYGYRTEATIPTIAGGAGVPIAGWLKVGRRWTYKGRKHSYVNARCANFRLQAYGEFTFTDGTFLSGEFFKPCTVRGG